MIATRLYFMPDVEVVCGACKGQRFNAETLQVAHKDKNIADVLDMSIEEGEGSSPTCRASAARWRC